MSHGDEVYDIIEDQDKKIVRNELLCLNEPAGGDCSPHSNDINGKLAATGAASLDRQHQLGGPLAPLSSEPRIALCRLNVSRNARRQMRFGDQKVVIIEGHYFGYLMLTSGPEPVFLATCTPIAMPETRECVVQGSTNVFTTIHSMDMKFLYVDAM